MENVDQQQFLANAEALALAEDDDAGAVAGARPVAPNRGRRGILKLALLCGVSFALIYLFAFKNIDASPPGPVSFGAAVDEKRDGADPRRVIQLRYFSCHPFNLIYRISLQTIFGLPGETVGTIPMFYSNYELEVVLRTANSSGGPRNWDNPHLFASQEPTAAYMYGAALLTLPRTTLLFAWLHDHNGAYRLLRNLNVDVLNAGDKLTMGGMRVVLRALGVETAQPAIEPAFSAADEEDAAADASSTVHLLTGPDGAAAPTQSTQGQGLGPLLWPLMVVCPGLVTCYLALALADTAPLAAGWIFLTGLLKAFCEIRVLFHSGLLAWRRRPQAAVQSLACSHGVPFMLGCHALLLLRLAGALLPARAFLYISFHLYGTWVPLVSAGITLMALRPNNANFFEGAMDGLLHLGHHRVAEEPHPTADGGADDGSGASGGPPKRRHHWPPPVHVPTELQESAEVAPKHLLCPITHHILTEPAVTSTGATYERSAIVEWLSKAGKDPLTGRTLSPSEVFPNLAMYSVVEEYVRESVKAAEKKPVAAAGRFSLDVKA